jgi:hypothetical protein
MQMELVGRATVGIEMFLNSAGAREFLPRSYEKAVNFHKILTQFTNHLIESTPFAANVETLKTVLDGFSVSLQDELDRIAMFTVTPKGNLDVHKLAGKISSGFPKATLELLNDFVRHDIDHSGNCLAFELPTSSGFHILRAVETCAKAYVHAATGQLPPIRNRNWGEYIERLKNAGAHDDVVDLLRILKAKRNPLMHPYDNLDVDEAISLLCICQAGIDTIVDDLRRKSLEAKFKESLKALPTL